MHQSVYAIILIFVSSAPIVLAQTTYPGQFIRPQNFEKLPETIQQEFKALPDGPKHFNHLHNGQSEKHIFITRRTPDYYAIFRAGDRDDMFSQNGLLLLWDVEGGSLLRPQHDVVTEMWGTQVNDSHIESDGITPEVRIAGNVIDLQNPNQQLPDGNLLISYSNDDLLEKSIRMTDNSISVFINKIQQDTQVSFTEMLPILQVDYEMWRVNDKRIMMLEYGNDLSIDLRGNITNVHWLSRDYVEHKALCALSIKANDRLTYTFRFEKP